MKLFLQSFYNTLNTLIINIKHAVTISVKHKHSTYNKMNFQMD